MHTRTQTNTDSTTSHLPQHHDHKVGIGQSSNSFKRAFTVKEVYNQVYNEHTEREQRPDDHGVLFSGVVTVAFWGIFLFRNADCEWTG